MVAKIKSRPKLDDDDHVWESKVTQTLERYYQHNHDHETKVICWTQTQPAFTDEQPTINQYDYGHGFYVLLATPLTLKLRDPTTKVQRLAHTIKGLIENIDSLIVRFPPTEAGALEREHLVNTNEAIDLPSGSVRSIKARLLNIKRHTKKDIGSKLYLRACKRIIHAIQCGAQYEKHKFNPHTGEVTATFLETKVCKLPCCARPICHNQTKSRKARATNKAIKRLTALAKDQDLRLVMVTLTQPYALPTEERRAQRHGYPQLHLIGRGKPITNRPTPPVLASERNYLTKNLDQHQLARSKFIANNQARDILAYQTHYVSEFAFLIPSVPGHRCFPNPHTHVLSAIPNSADLQEAQQQLQKVYQKTTSQPLAEVLVSPLYSDDATDEERTAALEDYFGKTFAVTPDVKDYRFRDLGIMASDFVNVVDDRSLAEVIDFYDFQPVKKLTASFNYTAEQQDLSSRKNRAIERLHRLMRPLKNKSKSKSVEELDSVPGVFDPNPAVIIMPVGTSDLWPAGEVLSDSQVPGSQARAAESASDGEGCEPENRERSSLEGQGGEVRVGCEVGGRSQGPGPASVGGLDDGGRTETRHVGDVSFVAESRMVPARGLLDQQAGDGWLAKRDHGNDDRELVASYLQAHPSQDADPGLWVEEDDDDLIAANKYMALVEEHLVHDLLRTCEQGDRARELKGLRVLVEPDDDLDSIDSIEVLGMDAEGSLAGSLVAGAEWGIGTGGDDGSEAVGGEAEQVLAVKATKPDSDVGGQDHVGGEGHRERDGWERGRPQSHSQCGVACSGIQEQRVQ